MADTVKKARLKGFTELGYIPDVVDESAAYSAAGARVKLEGAYSCSKTDNKTTTPIPADDNPMWDSETEWEDTTLTIVVRGMLLKDLAELQGVDFTGTELSETILDTAPVVALNFAALNAMGGYRCFTYYAAKLTSAQVSHQTKSGDTNLQDYTLEFSCKGRAADGRVRTTTDVATRALAQTWLESVEAYPVTP